MGNKILEVRDLGVSFQTYAGTIKAVRNISFDVYEGETLAIVGESGCGKTVTAKALMGLLPKPMAFVTPETQILYKGVDITKKDKKWLHKYRGSEVSMIFQDPMTSLNPTMTVGKQIEEALLYHNKMSKAEAKAAAIEKLKLVNIPNPEKRYSSYPHQLSGGMRQRVVIAIALACSPNVLIADEPTTALDVTIQAQIMELLKEIKEKTHTAIILVTHDLGVVANFADRVQVMYAGEIVERGTTHEIFRQPKHPYTRALLNSVPKVTVENKSELYSLKGTPPDLILDLQYCPFCNRCEFCMPICKEQKPGTTELSESHDLRCWLQHQQAPDVGFNK